MTRRDFEQLLTNLGYRFDRQHKHAIWINGAHEVGLPQNTAKEIKAWQVDELRRHHPDHPALKRSPGAGKGKYHGRERNRQSAALTLVAAGPAVKPPPVVVPNETSCVGCGRLWRSEIDPTHRPCPSCGGEVMIGRRETRDFRWRLAA